MKDFSSTWNLKLRKPPQIFILLKNSLQGVEPTPHHTYSPFPSEFKSHRGTELTFSTLSLVSLKRQKLVIYKSVSHVSAAKDNTLHLLLAS